MIIFLRKHHRWVWFVIMVLCIPFVFYFVQTPDYGAAFRENELGRIYDRSVSLTEYSQNARLLNLAHYLGMSLPNDLMTTSVKTENDMYVEFTWNRLVVRHEAEQLGIRPNAGEIKDFVTTLSRFRGADGNFDITKYTEFAKEAGVNQAHVEEIISDQLSLNRLKDLVAVGTQIPESENKDNYERAYGKLHVAVVRLQDKDFKNDARIEEGEIGKYFETNKDKLKTEEKRKVEFVTFSVADSEKKLTGKERIEALQKVADKANDFTQALLVKDAKFPEVAAQFESPVVATEEFTAASPPPQFEKEPQLAQYSFRLTKENPISDAIEGPDGYHVLHLLEIAEARPMEQEEARPKILETLTADKLRQLVAARGSEIIQQLKDGLKTGTSLEKAISQTRLKLSPWWPTEIVGRLGLRSVKESSGLILEQVPLFTLSETSAPTSETDLYPKYETQDFPMIRNTVANLNPGEVSEYTPVTDGGFIAVLEKRDAPDPSGYAEAVEKFEKGSLTQRRKAVFVEWLRDRRKAAKVAGPVAAAG